MCSGDLQADIPPHPLGNSDGYQNKGLAGKAICKTMKTKGEQFALRMKHAQSEGYPPPPVFAKKSPQTVENKRHERQKTRKREKKSEQASENAGFTRFGR